MRSHDENYVWRDMNHKSGGISCKHDILDFILTVLRHPSKDVNQPVLVHYGLCLLDAADYEKVSQNPLSPDMCEAKDIDDPDQIIPPKKSKQESLHKQIIDSILEQSNDEGTSLIHKNFEGEMEKTITKSKSDPSYIRLNQMLNLLQEKIGLDHLERKIIRFALASQALRRFDQNHEIYADRYRHGKESFEYCIAEAFAGDDYLKALEIESYFSSNKKLAQFSLVESDGSLGKKLLTYLVGKGSLEDIMADYYAPTVPVENHQLEQFHKLQEQTKILKQIIEGHTGETPLNILIHGPAGTGKKAYAHALTNHLGYKLFNIFIPHKNAERCSPYGSMSDKQTSLVLAEKTIGARDVVLLIEGCELLKGDGYREFDIIDMDDSDSDAGKPEENHIFHSGKSVRLWITHHPLRISHAYLRRFDYAIEFQSFSKSDRVEMWKRIFSKYQMDPDINQETIQILCKYEKISVTGMDLLMRNYLRMNGTQDKPELRFDLDAARPLINTHLGLMKSVCSKITSDDRRPVHRPELVSVKGSFQLTDCIGVVENFLKSKRESAIGKGLSGALHNLNILFHGPPGTGKTEFVRYLCEKLELDLITKTGSSILGMYVGETEKNIAKAFEEGSVPNTLLFIDEIDSLLHQRATAVRSWEVSQISELLIQMERFQGILVCASNFIGHIDHAAIRRFHMKMEFDYLFDVQKVSLFKYYFSPMIGKDLSEDEVKKVAQIPCLTPGDFGAVHRRISLHQNIPTVNQIIELLIGEASYKSENKNKIGFL